MDIRVIIKKYAKKILDHRPIINTKVEIKLALPNKILFDRCALITGGTSGIGYAIAESFLRAGANVIITGRNEATLQKSVSSLRREFSHSVILGYRLDNTDVSSFDPVFNSMLNACKKENIESIDILVNNAGINCQTMPKVTESEYDTVMDTNLRGPYFLSQHFGKYLIDNEIKGNILNISSASSVRPGNSPYILSKWGIRSLTLGLAKALAPYNITVNAIAPGPTLTPMLNKKDNDTMYLEKNPFHRYITPDEVASMAVILVSDMGRSILGDTIFMTGGAGILTLDDVPYIF